MAQSEDSSPRAFVRSSACVTSGDEFQRPLLVAEFREGNQSRKETSPGGEPVQEGNPSGNGNQKQRSTQAPRHRHPALGQALLLARTISRANPAAPMAAARISLSRRYTRPLDHSHRHRATRSRQSSYEHGSYHEDPDPASAKMAGAPPGVAQSHTSSRGGIGAAHTRASRRTEAPRGPHSCPAADDRRRRLIGSLRLHHHQVILTEFILAEREQDLDEQAIGGRVVRDDDRLGTRRVEAFCLAHGAV